MLSQSEVIKRAIERVADAEIEKKTAPCFRTYKAIITEAPNGTTCKVRLSGDDTELTLPYASKLSELTVGKYVWVGAFYNVDNSFSNAIVWETLKMDVGGGGGGSVTVDDALSTTSTNPVQNRVITNTVNALHQSLIGSWMPDFANLKPISTHEFDIASTSYYKICERPNVTSIKDIADEVLAFRITVTGTNIFAVADVIARLQPTVNFRPLVTVNYQTQSTSAATTGIQYLRTVNPKAANTSYTYEIAIAAYNTTKRHIKVEVFKAPSEWVFSSAATVYSYNSTYQTASDLTLCTSIGIFYNYTFFATANYANYAGYKSSCDSLFNGQGNFINAGAAIAANQFVFIGKDNKVYPTTSTSVEIDPAWPIVYCTTAYAADAAIGWWAIRSWGYFTPASSILKDGTLVADGTVYMRCTYTNGKLYSANTMTQNLTAGNTYIKLGKMYSATAVSVNTYNSEYFTLDADGHLKALNGYLFTATKADAVLAYTAANVAFDTTNHSLVIPIDGTQYKVLQVNVFNNDLTYGLGYPRTFIFNAGGTVGYIENTSTYCTASSAASGITVTFDSSWAVSASTNVDITVLYRRIS